MPVPEKDMRDVVAATAAIDLSMDIARKLNNYDALAGLTEAKCYLWRLPGFEEHQ